MTHRFASFATAAAFAILLPASALATGVTTDANSHFAKQLKNTLAYPEAALDANQQGTVIISVSVDQSNDVVGIHLDQSSGVRSLDQAAMDAARNTSPTWDESVNGVVRARIAFKL